MISKRSCSLINSIIRFFILVQLFQKYVYLRPIIKRVVIIKQEFGHVLQTKLFHQFMPDKARRALKPIFCLFFFLRIEYAEKYMAGTQIDAHIDPGYRNSFYTGILYLSLQYLSYSLLQEVTNPCLPFCNKLHICIISAR